ncbi:TPA: hypothetical protein EYP38_01040 [Candidatus Micrarchaeota archaeon]|nr:hypothetical protein [Candidatus Micrarchaeota archaeon]
MSLISLKIVLPNELLRKLEVEAKRRGFKSVNDYIVHILSEAIKEEKELTYLFLRELMERIKRIEKGNFTEDFIKSVKNIIKSVKEEKVILSEELINRAAIRVERKIFDIINPYTSKIDGLNRKIAEVIERFETLENKVNTLEQQLAEMQKVSAEVKEKPRKSAIEILKEQKTIFESEIMGKIRNRDLFFNRLERDGAKIIQTKSERIAVDPDFWNYFVNKVRNLKARSVDELRRKLPKVEYKLFNRLKESALLYYNAVKNRWEIITS